MKILFQGCDFEKFIFSSFCFFHLGSFDIDQQRIRLQHQQLLLSRKIGDIDVGDNVMMTVSKCWGQNQYVSDFFRYDFILNMSPTKTVPNIRHQHQTDGIPFYHVCQE